jgi:hypothetical protein
MPTRALAVPELIGDHDRHLAYEQNAPLHSLSLLHDVRQALPAQTYFPQLCVCTAGQLPAPSQLAARIWIVELWQLCARHCEVGKEQAVGEEPLQLPWHVPEPLHAPRAP